MGSKMSTSKGSRNQAATMGSKMSMSKVFTSSAFITLGALGIYIALGIGGVVLLWIIVVSAPLGAWALFIPATDIAIITVGLMVHWWLALVPVIVFCAAELKELVKDALAD